MKVGILGTGAYGLSLSSILKSNKHDIMMWTKFESEKELLLKERENKKLLEGYKLDKSITITTDLEQVMSTCKLIIIAIPVGFINETMNEVCKHATNANHFCIASKGIEQESGSFVMDIIRRHIDTDNIAVISGPTFAVDLITDKPKGLTLATSSDETRSLVKKALANYEVKLEDSEDIIGVEISGAIKNVIAISSGILEGLGANESTKAMFLTKAIQDMQNLMISLGGKEKTLITYAFLGDLLLTCTSEKSRNYRYGVLVGKRNQEAIENYSKNTTVEGLYTLTSIHKLLKDNKIKIPVINVIYDIVIRKYDAEEMIKYLRS